jgi:hypothetical protein
MIQNLITELVCIDCNANLMRDLAEDGALFDTARGNGGTTSSGLTGFDCPTRMDFGPHVIDQD